MDIILLTSVGILGMLSFFEPCTIATHALFSVRVNQQQRGTRIKLLLSLWLTRSILFAAILSAIVLATRAQKWGNLLPGIAIAIMATLYLVSRIIYIPIPHLEFFKLIPSHKSMPQSVRLGLTLPACTIPLFTIVTGITMWVHSLPMALLAALLFASSFTLPVAIIAFTGIQPTGRNLLNNAARATPFLTAILLYGTAIFLI